MHGTARIPVPARRGLPIVLQHAMASWSTLSIALAGLRPDGGVPWSEPRAAIEWVAQNGFRCVQLDAAMPGLRPRELDRSARRGVVSLLQRLELSLSGLDLWIPAEHFSRPDTQQRAIDAVESAIALAADCRRAGAMLTVSVNLPDPAAPWRAHLAGVASRHGVPLANFSSLDTDTADPTAIGLGLDPAHVLEQNAELSASIARASQALLAARLSDWNGSRRVPIGRGKLDLMAYGASLSAAAFSRPVVLDVRDLQEPLNSALEARTMWPPF